MILNRIKGVLLALVIGLAVPGWAFAAQAVLPNVKDSLGHQIPAGAVICVDLTGASISCGAAGTVAAGEAHIGQVGGLEVTPTVTPTIQAASYVSGNCMGGFNAVTVARINGGTGFITDLRLTSLGGATTAVTVYLFDANPSASTCTDKSTFTLAAADVDKLIGPPIALTPVAPTGTTVTTAAQTNLGRAFVAGGSAASGVKTIYEAFVAGGTFTPGSTTDLHLKIGATVD